MPHILSGLSALVVDDQSVHLSLLKRKLEALNVTAIAEAKNGSEAVKAVAEKAKSGSKFDLIFMDINMPVMDGRTAAKHIHKHYPQQTIITHTTENPAEILEFASLFVAYLPKGASRDELYACIIALLPRIVAMRLCDTPTLSTQAIISCQLRAAEEKEKKQPHENLRKSLTQEELSLATKELLQTVVTEADIQSSCFGTPANSPTTPPSRSICIDESPNPAKASLASVPDKKRLPLSVLTFLSCSLQSQQTVLLSHDNLAPTIC